jgi:hypothetical protein
MRQPPTGEPCAGEPPARFGGRGGFRPFPTPIKMTVCNAIHNVPLLPNTECLGLLLFNFDVQRRRVPTAAKLERGVTEFDTYIRNNQKFNPNFGERYRQGDTISTAFVESTINQVVSKRFVKRQQMQWSQKGAHLLLQTRTKVLDGDLEGVFRGWYPQFRPVFAASPTP